MSKHNELTAKEVDGYNVTNIEKWISDYADKTGIPKKDVKILDYGSGRGKTVAALRKLGYNAFGVEIDPIPFNNGIPYFESAGLNHDEIFQLIDESCVTKFEDGFFDLLFTEQVLEHVENLEIVAAEFERITKKGGEHRHAFPAKYHYKEQHLFMPMIHWAPKNFIRHSMIKFYVGINVEPKWKQLDGKSKKEKSKVYFDYSAEKTYYRPMAKIHRTFEQKGFSTRHKPVYTYATGLVEKVFNKVFPTQIRLFLTKK